MWPHQWGEVCVCVCANPMVIAEMSLREWFGKCVLSVLSAQSLGWLKSVSLLCD